MWVRAAALTFILAFGCSCAPRRSFPIGIYGVTDAAQLEKLHDSGFDHVYAYGPKLNEIAVMARRFGMRLIVTPESAWGAPSGATANWPMAAWYLQDEPDVNKMPPEVLEAKAHRVRGWDPKRPQTFVVGAGRALKSYSHIGDIAMLDWYPVPHLPLSTVAEQVDQAVAALPQGKPLWFVVQAFDWREDPQPTRREPVGRFPDHREIRFMSWMAVMHGASGLFFYRLEKPGGATLLDYPELWQAVARVSREFRALRRVLSDGLRTNLPFPPNPDGPEARAWRWRGRTYVVIANRKADKYQKVPSELLESRWRPLNEQTRYSLSVLKQIGAAWYLRPYQVLILEGPLGFTARGV